ncbi:MAG TPA: hypothetical protein PLU30_12790 [Verrucomicrobiae bacterium]|nr:hypothetical protein [Verrucomicrobiae bacterium]
MKANLRTSVRLPIFALVTVALTGCIDDEPRLLMENTIDLVSPNGIHEVLLLGGLNEALGKIDWTKYANKNVYVDTFTTCDGYADKVLHTAVKSKLHAVGANILTITKSEENKDKSDEELKRETEYQYDLTFTAPVSGVYSYEGFFSRQYVAHVMVNLVEAQKGNGGRVMSGGLIEKRFQTFIPGQIFVVSCWTVASAILIMAAFRLFFGRCVAKQFGGR